MAALASAAEIPPGGEGAIKTSISTRGRSGVVSKVVTVESTDPNSRFSRLRLKATVIVEAALQPRSINLGRLNRGETITKTTKLIARDPAKTKITSVEAEATEGELTAKIVEVGDNQGVAVSYKGTKTGVVRGRVEVTTNSKKRPTINVMVRGLVLGTWELIPRTVSFPEPGEDGEPPRRTLRIKARTETNFRITKVEDSEDVVTAKITKSDNGYEVELTLSKTPEKRRGTLEITTTDPEERTLKARYFIRRPRRGRVAPNRRRLPRRPAKSPRRARPRPSPPPEN